MFSFEKKLFVVFVSCFSLALPVHASMEDDAQRHRSTIKQLQAFKPPFQFTTTAALLAASLAAPADESYQSTAYRTKNDCAFFFVEGATHGEWFGPPCRGKMVAGQGELRVTIPRFADGQEVGHEQVVFKGSFKNGYLEGAGIKQAWLKYHSGTQSGRLWTGNFRRGVLHGMGKRVMFVPGGAPELDQVSGVFHEGAVNGTVDQVRIRPYAGAIGEVVRIVYKADSAYSSQAHHQREAVNGYLLAENGEYEFSFENLKDGMYSDGELRRLKLHSDTFYFHGACDGWRQEEGGWHCRAGTFAFQEGGGTALITKAAKFSISLASNRQPVTVYGNAIFIPAVNALANSLDELHCEPDLSSCKGRLGFQLISDASLVWRGEVAYRAGMLTPAGRGEWHGDVRISSQTGSGVGGDDDDEAEGFTTKTIRIATCENMVQFECENGTVYLEAANFEGPFVVDNVKPRKAGALEAAAYSRIDDGRDVNLLAKGWGKLVWEETGRWARVRMRDRNLVEVSDCGNRAGEDFTCSVVNGKVRFSLRRQRQPTTASEAPRYQAPKVAPPRFEPIQIPNR